MAHRHRHQRQDDDRADARVDPAGRRAAGLQRRQRRHPGARGGAGPRALRRPRRRAVQLPAALVALAGPAGVGRASTSRPTTSTGTARSTSTPRPRARSTPTPRSPASTTCRTTAPSGSSRRPRSRRAAGRSASPSASPGRPSSASSTTCWPTGPSSSSAAPPQPSSPRSTTCAATRRARRRTSSPTRWPRPRWPARTACRPAPCATGCGPSCPSRTASPRSAPSTASAGSTTPRPPTRTPPRRQLRRLRARRVGRRRPAQGRRRRRPRRGRRPTRLRGVVLIGRDRARDRRRHWPDTRRMSPSSTSTAPTLVPWTWWSREARALAHEGDVVLLAPAAASMDMFADYGARGDAFVGSGRPARRGGVAGEQRDRTGPREQPHGTTRHRPLAGWPASTRPVTTYYLLVCVTVALVVFGLIMVLSASAIVVHRPTTASRLHDLPQPGRVRRRSAPSRWSSPRGCRSRPGSASRCPILLVGVRAPAARAHPAGHQRQRQPELDPRRPGHRAAVRDRQGRAGARRCASSCRRSASSLHSLSHVLVPYLVPVAAAEHRRRRRSATTSAPCSSSARSSPACCSPPGIPLRWFAFAGGPFVADRHRVRRHQPQPAGPLRRLARPRHQRVRRRPPADPRPLRPGRRRLVRASASAPAARSGGCSPSRTTTSSSRSSARSSGCPAPSSSCCSSPCSPWPATASSPAPSDHFVRIATAGIMTWLIVQALINIGAVIGLLPVIGVPLPLVSSGGSSLITTHVRPRHPAVLRARRTRLCRGPVGAAVGAAPLAGGHPRRRRLAPDARMTPEGPRSVLLAGGGTAGHVSPLLALADCLRRRDPDVVGHRAGHRRRARGAARARARLPAARGAQGAAAAPPLRRPAAPAGQPAPRGAGRRGRHRRDRRRGRRRLRRLRRRPRPTSRPGAAASRSSSTSRTPGPGWPTGSAPGSPPASASPSPAPACRTPPSPGCRCAARSRRSTAPPAGPRRATGFGLDRRRRRCSSPAARSAPSGSTTPSPARPRRCRPRACRCCTSPARARSSCPTPRRGAPYVVLAVLRPDGPRLRRRRPRRRALRRQHGLRAHRRRAARRLRARCRSATASSGSTPPPSSPPAAACSSTTPTSPRRGSTTSCARSPLDAGRLAAMAAAAASVGERGGDELLADLVVAAARGRPADDRPHPALRLHRARAAARAARARCTSSPSAAPACRPSPGSCSPAACRSAAPTPPTAPRCESLRDSGCPRRTSATTPAHVDRRRHRRRVVGRSATTTSSSPPPAPPGLRVLHRSQALASLMGGSRRVAVAGANGKTTTTSMLVVALQSPPVPTPRSPRAARSRSSAPTPPSATAPAFVVEADESDGSFLVYRPDVAVVTNVQPDHLDFYGTVAGGRGGLRRLRRRPSPTAGSLVACHDDAGSRRLADAARAAGRAVLTYGHDAGRRPAGRRR